MMDKIKRAVSLLLTFMMIFNMMPVSAVAAAMESYSSETYNAANSGLALLADDTATGYAITAGSSTSLWPGQSLSFTGSSTITVTGGMGGSQSYNVRSHSWSVSDTTALSITSSSTSQQVTIQAASNAVPGQYVLTDTLTYRRDNWTQTAQESIGITVYGVKLNSLTTIKNNQTLEATYSSYLPEGATLTWTSSDTNVATVDNNGKINGVAGGTATITVTATSGSNSVSSSQTITVEQSVSSMTVSESSLSLFSGDSATVTVEVTPAEFLDDIVWTSTKDTIATVSKSTDGGTLTITAVSAGTAVIIGTAPNGKIATITVTVPAISLEVEPATVSIVEGEIYYAYTMVTAPAGYTLSAVSSDTDSVTVVETSAGEFMLTGVKATTTVTENTDGTTTETLNPVTVTYTLVSGDTTINKTMQVNVSPKVEAAQYYTISFYDFNGAIISATNVVAGTQVTVPTIAASAIPEGYEYKGFRNVDTTASDYTQTGTDGTVTPKYYVAPATITVNGDVGYHAVYESIYYTVTYNDSTVTSLNPQNTTTASEQVLYNNVATKPADPTSTARYRFDGWQKAVTTNGVTTYEPYDFFSPVTQDITLYAKWEPQTFTVTLLTFKGPYYIYEYDLANNTVTRISTIENANGTVTTTRTDVTNSLNSETFPNFTSSNSVYYSYAYVNSETNKGKTALFQFWQTATGTTTYNGGTSIPLPALSEISSDIVYNAIYEPNPDGNEDSDYHADRVYLTVRLIEEDGTVIGEDVLYVPVTALFGNTDALSGYNTSNVTSSTAKFGTIDINDLLGQTVTVDDIAYIIYDSKDVDVSDLYVVWLCSQASHVYSGTCAGGTWNALGIITLVVREKLTDKAQIRVNYYTVAEDGTVSSSPFAVTNTALTAEDTVNNVEGEILEFSDYVDFATDRYNFYGYEWVTGKEGDEAQLGEYYELNLYYTDWPYDLTIDYVYEDGTEVEFTEGVDSTYTHEYHKNDLYFVASPELEGYTPSVKQVSGTMPGQDIYREVVYTRDTGTLKIVKTVKDSTFVAGTEDRTFTFSVTGPDNYSETKTIEVSGAGNPSSNYIELAVPTGEYTVRETATGDYTYTTVGSGSTATVNKDSTATVTITNTRTGTENITVTKSWKENDGTSEMTSVNKDNLSVWIGLKASVDGFDKSAVEFKKDDWSESFEVTKFTSDGNEINYTPVEFASANGAALESGDELEIGNYKFTVSYNGNTVINKLGTAQLTITKQFANETDLPTKEKSFVIKYAYDGKTYNLTAKYTPDNGFSYIGDSSDTKANGNVLTLPIGTTVTVEEEAYNGWEASYSTQSAKVGDVNTVTVTNTYTGGEKKQITGTKVWVDGDDVEKKRPTSITINLKQNNSNAPYKTTTANAEGGWNWSFTGLPTYDTDGTLFVYTISEEKVVGYTTKYEPAAKDSNGTVAANDEESYTITNTIDTINDTANIVVTKNWIDESDYAGLRPQKSAFTVTLTGKVNGNDVTGATHTISGDKWDGEDNTWTETVVAVRKYDDQGNRITYTASESTIAAYTNGSAVYNNTEANKSIIPATDGTNLAVSFTNTYEPTKTSVTAQKVWDDSDNVEGIRPASVTLKLYADGVEAKYVNGTVVETKATEGGEVTWTGLPTNKEGTDNNPIVYTVYEMNGDAKVDEVNGTIPSLDTGNNRNYTVTYSGDHLTVTNTYDVSADRVTVNVTKAWSGADVPAEATVEVALKKSTDGSYYSYYPSEAESKKNLQISDGTYSAQWTELPKYTKVGDEWVVNQWKVVETSVPNGWHVAAGEEQGVAAAGEGNVKTAALHNERDQIPANSLTITKIVDGYTDAMAGDTFTIQLNMPSDVITGTVVNLTTGTTQTSATVQSAENGSKYIEIVGVKHNETVVIATALPTGNYTVTEDILNAGTNNKFEYELVSVTKKDLAYTVTNKANAGDLKLKKSVKDSEFVDGTRTFNIVLTASSGVKASALSAWATAWNKNHSNAVATASGNTLTIAMTVTGTAALEDSFEVELESLPNGTYSVAEATESSAGYSVAYIPASAEAVVNGTSVPVVTVTNTKTDKLSVQVTKNWDIPEYVKEDLGKATLTLERSVDNTAWESAGEQPIEVEDRINATETWTNLEKYNGIGQKYTYRVVESYEHENVTVYDGNEQKLDANEGKYYQVVTNGAVTFVNKFNLTTQNALTVKKVVTDNVAFGVDNKANFEITVQRHNTDVDETADNAWIDVATVTLSNIEPVKLSEVIGEQLAVGTYRVRELSVNTNVWTPTYSENVTLNESNSGELSVTNTRVLANDSVKFYKKWMDDSDALKLRPDDAEFESMLSVSFGSTFASAIPGADATITQKGADWTIQYTNLPKYTLDGTEYIYTMKEELDVEYTLSNNAPATLSDWYSADKVTVNAGNTITNTLKKIGDAGITVTKEIDGYEALMANDTFIITVTLPSGPVYTDNVTFTPADTNAAVSGNEITLSGMGHEDTVTITGVLPAGTYTVSETGAADANVFTYAEEKYVPETASANIAVNGTQAFKVINTPETTTTVTGTKTWVDNSNAEQLRPTDLTLNLYKTTMGASATESDWVEFEAEYSWAKEGNSWTYTYVKLPKYELVGGQKTELTYKVEEVEPTHYEQTASDDRNFTNTINPDAKVNVYVTKTWDVPTGTTQYPTVTFNLLQDGAVVEAKTQTLTGPATAVSFTGLTKYNASGRAYVYTVTEDAVDGYTTTSSVTSTSTDQTTRDVTINYAFTNKYADEKKSVTVNKVWQDKSGNVVTTNVPNSVTITVTGSNAIGTATTTDFVLTKDNQYTVTNSEMLKYLTNGELVNYTASENTVPSGYELVGSIQKVQDGTTKNDTFTVTNKYTGGKRVSITVTKKWDAPVGTAWTPATLTLYRSTNANATVATAEVVDTYTTTKTETTEQTGTIVSETKEFSDLDSIAPDGNPYYYFIVESNVPSGFTSDDNGAAKLTLSGEDTLTATETITNTYGTDTDKVNISVTKQWLNGEQTDTTPDNAVVLVQLMKSINGGAYENVGEPVPLTKVDGDYKYTWNNQVKYAKVDGNWVTIAYKVVETKAPTGWVIGEPDGVVVNTSYSATITNNRAKSIETAYPVTKVWEPANDADKFGIKVTVMRKANNIEQEFKVVTLTDEDTNWTEYLGAVETHDVNGNPYEYYIKADSETYADAEDSAKLAWYTDTYNGLTVTNKRKTTSAEVTKELPQGSADGDKFQFRYFIDDELKGTFWLDANKLSEKIDNLNVGDKLTVEEIKKTQSDETTVVTYYTVDYGAYKNTANTEAVIANLSETAASNAITVINTRKAVTSMTLEKNVSDPDHNANKEFIFKYRVNGSGDWKTVTRTHADGPVKLTDGLYVGDKVEIAEIEDADYVFPAVVDASSDVKTEESAIDNKNVTLITIDQLAENNEVVFTNTRETSGLKVSKTVTKPATTGIDGTATGDAVNTDASTEFTFTLKKDNLVEANAEYTIGTSTEKKYTDTNGQFKLKDGETATFSALEVGNYTVTETDESDWTVVGEATKSATVATDSNASISFTNTRDTVDLTAPIQKIWQDNGNAYGTRPESVKLQIVGKVGDKPVYTADVTLTDDNELDSNTNTWERMLTNLPKTHGGETIVYTAAEQDVPTVATGANVAAGTVYVKSAESGLTVTNTLAGKTDSLEFTKKWDDQDNKYNRRPTTDAFKAMLKLNNDAMIEGYAVDGSEVTFDKSTKLSVVKTSDQNEWTITFTDLPLYTLNGVKYEYTLTEELTGKTAAWYTSTDAEAKWIWDNTGDVNDLGLENTLKMADVTITKQIVDNTALAVDKFAVEYTYSYDGYEYTTNDNVTTATAKNYTITGSATLAKDGKIDGLTWPADGTLTIQEVAKADVWNVTWNAVDVEVTGSTVAAAGDKPEKQQGVVAIDADDAKLDVTLTNTRKTTTLPGTKTWTNTIGTAAPSLIYVEVEGKVGEETVISGSQVVAITDGGFVITSEDGKDLPTHTDDGDPIEYTIVNEYPVELKEGQYVQIAGYYWDKDDSTGNALVNDVQTGTFTLTKTGSAGALLSGAEFTLYAKTDAGYAEDIKATAVDTQTTDANGKLTFTGIALGEYWLVETQAPNGYTLPDKTEANAKVVKVEPDTGNDELATVTITGNDWEIVNGLTSHSLTLKKSVIDEAAYNNYFVKPADFDFTVALDSMHKGYTVTIGTTSYTDGGTGDTDGTADGKVTITGVKIKDTDADAAKGIGEVTITGIPLGTNVTITENASANVWSTAWDGEDSATGKVAVVVIDASEMTVTATNTRILLNPDDPNTDGDLMVTKVWEDESNLYGTRPDSVTMQLWAKAGTDAGENAELAQSLNSSNAVVTTPNDPATEADETVTDADRWTYTWTNLPAYSLDGKEYTYDVIEDGVVDGILSGKMDSSYTMTDNSGYGKTAQTINNSLKMANLTVSKRVIDLTGEQAASKALYFGFKVKNANDAYITDTANKNVVYIKHDESATFVNLPIGATFTVEEIGVFRDAEGNEQIANGLNAWTKAADANGVVTIAKDGSSVAYTNTRILLDNNGELTFTKKWDDESNKFGNRPTQEKFNEMLTLYYNSANTVVNNADGVKKVPTITGSDDIWTIKYDQLAKYDLAGSLYNYTLTEVLDSNAAKWYQSDDDSVTWLANGENSDLELNNSLQKQNIVINKLWQLPNGNQVSAVAYGDTNDQVATATMVLYAVTDSEDAVSITGTYAQGADADTVTFANVPAGNYVVKESDVNNTGNYDVSTTAISVTWDAETNEFVYNTQSQSDGNKTITNLLKRTDANNGALTITKVIDWKETSDKTDTTFDIGYAYELPDGTDVTGTITVAYDADENTYTYSSEKNDGENVFVDLPYGTTVTFTESPNAAWKPSMSGALDTAATLNQNSDTKAYTISGDVTVSADKKAVEVKNTRVLLNPDKPEGEQGKIKVIKNWSPVSVAKPSSLYAQLLWNDVAKETKPFAADWTVEFTKLPAYDLNGQPYTYTVLEAKSETDTYGNESVITLTATDGKLYSYEVAITGTQASGAFTITNTYKSPEPAEKIAGEDKETDNLNLGDTISYTIKRTSHLNQKATATIKDVLPKGLTYVNGSATVDGVPKEPDSKVVKDSGKTELVWNNIPVDELATVTVTYEATVNVDAITAGAAELKNVVEVKFTDEPEDINFQGADETVYTPVLSIAKEIEGSTTVRTNDTVTYKVTVTNSGAADATNVKIVDKIPEGLSNVEINGKTAEMNADRLVETIIPGVAAGGSETVKITAKVTALAGTIDKNLVTITEESSDPTGEDPKEPEDPDGPDNPFKAESDPLTVKNPRLKITKLAKDDSGETNLEEKEFAFVLSGGSNGIAGVKFTKGEASGLMTDGNFNLKNGESITFELPIDVNENAKTIYMIDENETAWNLTFTGTDGNDVNADQQGTVTFAATANGETEVEVTATNVRKMINEESDDPDDDGKLQVTKVWLEANGKNPLTAHIADETVKVNLYRSSSAEAVTETPFKKTIDLKAVDWTDTFDKLPATDAAGNPYTYTVKEVDETGAEKVEGDEAMFTTATAGDLFFEVTIDQSSTSEGYTITNKLKDQKPDGGTEKTADVVDKDELKAEINDTIEYTIKRTSTFGRTTKATVTDKLPEGLEFAETLSVKINDTEITDYTFDQTAMTWTIDNVPPMGTVTVKFSAVVTEDAVKYDEIKNTASVDLVDTADGSFKDNGDPEDDEIIEVLEPDLKLTKKLAVEKVSVKAGETFAYTLSITNRGEGRATNVEVKDTLPEQIEAQLDGTTALTLSEDGKSVTWNVGTVEAGETVSVTFDVTVKSESDLGDSTMIVNGAEITKQPPENPNTPDNPEDKEDPDGPHKDTETTPIFRIDINKTARVIATGEYADVDNNPNTASLGDIIEFKVTVKNLGGIAAEDIVIEDLMIGKAIEKNIEISDLLEKIMVVMNLEENQMILPRLEPGKKVEFTYQYKVTEEDILAQSVKNIATATVQDPDDPEDPYIDQDETESKTDPTAPSFKLTKEIINSDGKPYGFKDEIKYRVTFTNDGNVSLTETVIDDVAGAGNELKSFDLETVAPGETVTIEYTYTVQDGDLRPTYKADGVTVEDHYVTNTATVTTKPANEPDKPRTGSASVTHKVEQWYTAIFVDTRTNEVVEFINVPYGGSIQLPDAPEHRGYNFLGWRSPILDNITFNQVIYAYYERDTETIFDARIPLAGGYISNVGDCFD